jgi:hypothetical protein
MISIAMAASLAWSLRSPIFLMHFLAFSKNDASNRRRKAAAPVDKPYLLPLVPLPTLSSSLVH